MIVRKTRHSEDNNETDSADDTGFSSRVLLDVPEKSLHATQTTPITSQKTHKCINCQKLIRHQSQDVFNEDFPNLGPDKLLVDSEDYHPPWLKSQLEPQFPRFEAQPRAEQNIFHQPLINRSARPVISRSVSLGFFNFQGL